jgi:trk system potassium uptake protein TrkH
MKRLRYLGRIDQHPQRYLIALYAVFVLVGALLLALPVSRTHSMEFIDVLFTATSAACVTGLMTVDAGKDFTYFGQGVILLLIQVGGVGIMTFGVLFMSLVGAEISQRDSSLVVESLTYRGELSISRLLGRIVVFTLILEAIGTVALFFAFWHAGVTGMTAWSALFHAVSALCNAGIGLYSDSLGGFIGDPAVNIIIILLIICGGLGFVTLVETAAILFGASIGRKRLTHLSLQSKIVLTFTFGFIIAGTVLSLALEWNHGFREFDVAQRIIAALFHSVTTRTAGFATFDTSQMSNGLVMATMILMFIGGAPGSAAGGIKVTTFAVLLFLVVIRLRGAERPHLFRRSITEAVVARALAIFAISTMVIILFALALMMTETSVGEDWDDRGQFIAILFETVSAFGTVGLSMGETPELSAGGKILVIILMFIGRLGPLTIAMGMARRKRKGAFSYAEENIMVG